MGTLHALYLSTRRGIFFLFFLLKHFRTYTGLHYRLTCRSAAQPRWRGAHHPSRHGKTCQGSPSPSRPEILWHWRPAPRGGCTVAVALTGKYFLLVARSNFCWCRLYPLPCALSVWLLLSGLKKRSSFVAWLICRAH